MKRFMLIILLLMMLSDTNLAATSHAAASSRVYLPTIFRPPLQIVLSEFMAANDSRLPDDDGDYSDWIELANQGSDSVNLAGWYLTDNANRPTKWPLPPLLLHPGDHLIIFASGKDRRTVGQQLHTNFKLSSMGEYLALIKPDGRSPATEYAPLYPPQYRDLSYGLDPFGKPRFFTQPTPGATNSRPADQGPIVYGQHHTPAMPTPDQPLTVTAQVARSGQPVAQVTLTYRVMYQPPQTVPMFDDGQHGDGATGDGVYGATLPAAIAQPGEMVRYAITASDTLGRSSRWPLFHDPENSPEYWGTMVAHPEFDSQLQPLFFFSEKDANPRRGSLFYNGRFYDNIFIRHRGHTSSGLKFDMNTGDWFYFAPDQDPVEEFNVNSSDTDKSYIRRILSWEAFRDAQAPHSIAFPLLMVFNGRFHSVATFIEQPDERYLERQGYDDEGALYKMGNGLVNDDDHFEKKTRQNEDNQDLITLTHYTNNVSGLAQYHYFLDNLDLPTIINYLAVLTIIHDNDATVKNYYLYRDSNGSGEWLFFPWDKDLTFGRGYRRDKGVKNDIIIADKDNLSHPLFGAEAYRDIAGWNRLIDAIYSHEPLRQMYLRRLRTIMDQLLQPPGTPASLRQFEQRIDALYAQMQPDVDWRGDSIWDADWGQRQSFAEAVQIIKDDYLEPRRVHLYQTHGPSGSGLIPAAQPTLVDPRLETAVLSPPSGNPDEAYLIIHNPHPFALDLTGWKLTKDHPFNIVHPFKPGTVLLPNGRLYLSPNVKAFRQRQTTPSGGMGLFIQGNYDSSRLASSGSLQLYDPNGRLRHSYPFTAPASPLANQLIITEINYHPPDAGSIDGNEFEFIELKNVGTTPLNLANVTFSDGIEFDFGSEATVAPSNFVLLVSNQARFVSRYPETAVFGQYSKNLSNAGETITLRDAAGFVISSITYSDNYPWPTAADGDGYTLVRRLPPRAPNHHCSWRLSTNRFGSPGTDDPENGRSNPCRALYLPLLFR